jgi:hypothetical protein
VDSHSSARRHGIADEDIEHAVRNALAIDDQEAMKMRAKYGRLLPGG